MQEHKVGTHEEWQAARDELAKLEGDQAQRDQEISKRRHELPWVPVEKEYEFDTEGGRKTLAELFDGRTQLLAYNIMYGPEYTLGACPGCTGLADGFDGGVLHMNKRDVTFICFSRAPIDRLTAYKKRIGLGVPVRVDQRIRLPVRLRARDDRGAGAAGSRGQGDDREPAGVARVLGDADRG
jgi:predicted dithiol-disulfide oxidoreductase (DUF899 family)